MDLKPSYLLNIYCAHLIVKADLVSSNTDLSVYY